MHTVLDRAMEAEQTYTNPVCIARDTTEKFLRGGGLWARERLLSLVLLINDYPFMT